MDGSSPPPYNLCNFTHFTSTLPALSLPTINVPYAASVFDSQPPEVAIQAEETLDNPTMEIETTMQQWLAEADMSWIPHGEEGQFTRLPVHSLTVPRKPLSDISNTQPTGNMPPPAARPKAPAAPSAQTDTSSMAAPPVKTFSKRKVDQLGEGAPEIKKKTLKLKSKNQTYAPKHDEDILESVEGKHFGALIARVFELHDASIQKEEEHGTMITYQDLDALWTETAKLKANKSLSRVPTETLSRLVQIMDSYVSKGNNAKSIEEGNQSEKVKEILFLYGFVAALVIINILAADNIDKSLIVEEVLENILHLAKHSVTHNIIPAFDPLVEKKQKSKVTMEYIRKLVTLLNHFLDVLNELAAKEPLTDSMVLDICSITLPTFFMEGGNELQLHALTVVRTIFSRYDKHRTLILEDIFTSLTKLPKTKRTLRTYRLAEDNKAIQMVSALVLQLIQCCPSLVKLSVTSAKRSIDLEPQQAKKQKENEDGTVTITDANSYEAAVACAHAFMTSFVAKCSTREEDNDYRQILTNFVEDLLITINLPEWPASQVLLRVLSGILLKNVKKDSKESTVLKTFSIDILGSVTAKVKKEMSLAHQWMEILPGNQIKAEEEDASCVCNATDYSGQFMLDCDDCHKWFHGACVGVSPDNVPPQWYCDTCLIRRRVRSRKRNSNSSDSTSLDNSSLNMSMDVEDGEKSIDMSTEEQEDVEIEAMRLMLLNYLRERSHSDSSATFSRQFFISQWCHGETDENRVQDYKSQWEINSKRSIELAERNERLVSRDGVMKIVRFLATKGSLFLSFDSLLNQILTLMNEPQTTFRAKGLKALTVVIEADPNTLGDTRVEQAVKGRFWDNAISVRSAAVDLVGKYVLERPEFTSQYYPMIAERILDKGVSVRKRVVKILSDVCLGQPHHSFIPRICKKLVTRIGDEDESIKETVLSTLQSLWFSPLPKKQDDKANAGSSGSKILDLSARVDQIIEVVTSGSQWFVDLLLSLLGKEGKDSKKPIHETCKAMVSCIVERIFVVDDQATEDLHSSNQANDMSEHMTARSVIGIIEAVAPSLEHPEPAFLASIEKDLEDLIYNIHLSSSFSWSVIYAAAKCFAIIVQKITGHHDKIMAVVNRFQSYLDKCRGMCTRPDLLTVTRVANAGRALFCLGHLCRYYEATSSKSMMASPFSKDPVLHNTFSLLTVYAQSVSPELQLRSIQAIGSIFVRTPELILKPQIQTIIKKSLASDSHDVRLQMLLNISEFLAAEEAKALSGAASKKQKKSKKSDKNKTKKKKRDENELCLDDSQDLNESLDASSHELFVEMDNSDSGVSNTIAQTFLQPILEHSLDSHVRVRAAALNTLGLIQRQGLMHPLQCVPHLVALETDRELGIADKAHRLLTAISEKFPTFLHNRFIDGIKLSYTFQKKVWGSCSALTQNPEMPMSVLAQLYTLFSDKRTTRNHFLGNIIRLFQKCTLSEETDVSFFRYLAELMLSLPYTYTDEVLCIIYNINKSISLAGGAALAALEILFKKAKATNTEIPAVPEKFKLSSMVMILLVLKHTLKRTYKLSDSRCKAYSPEETVKAREGRITEAPLTEFTLDSSPFAAIPQEFDSEDLPSLRKHYKEFKRMMREDDGDFDLKESKGRGKGRGRIRKAKEEENEDGGEDSEDKSPVAQRTRTARRGRKRKEAITSEETEDVSQDDKPKRKAPPTRKTKRRRVSSEEDSNDSDFVL